MAERDETRAFVERAGQGDAAAVDALLARHWDGLAAFLRRRAGAGLMAQESGAGRVMSVLMYLAQVSVVPTAGAALD